MQQKYAGFMNDKISKYLVNIFKIMMNLMKHMVYILSGIFELSRHSATYSSYFKKKKKIKISEQANKYSKKMEKQNEFERNYN